MKKIFLTAAVFTAFFTVIAGNNSVQFLKSVEGTVRQGNLHIVYDDANPKVKWNGKESFEQFKKRCSGRPTIGYGFTSRKMVEKCFITDKEADAELERLVKLCRTRLYKSVKVRLNSNQETALISFIYNVGGKKFEKSSLLKRINEKKFTVVPVYLGRWKYTRLNGKLVVSKGLVNRRNLEKKLFCM